MTETFNSRKPNIAELRIIHQHIDPNSTRSKTLSDIVKDKNDLLADFTAIITSFCARLYSKRRSKKISNDIKNSLPK